MGFENDSDIWTAYSKTIKKLEKPNKISPYFKKSPQINVARKVEPRSLQSRSIKNLNITKMSKKDKRNFVSGATIDLHGHSRNIDNILDSFCSNCISNKIKNIVIISGKGEGILKDSVLLWLNRSPRFVVSFFEIRDTFGESGAFAVRLRGF